MLHPIDGFPRLLDEPPLTKKVEGVIARIRLIARESNDSNANMPKFKYKIYPLGRFEKALPTLSRLKQDLVFSITLVKSYPSSRKLKSIQF